MGGGAAFLRGRLRRFLTCGPGRPAERQVWVGFTERLCADAPARESVGGSPWEAGIRVHHRNSAGGSPARRREAPASHETVTVCGRRGRLSSLRNRVVFSLDGSRGCEPSHAPPGPPRFPGFRLRGQWETLSSSRAH